jgi:hypothetical protein
MKNREESAIFYLLNKLNEVFKEDNLNQELFYGSQYDLIVQEGEVFSTEKWNKKEQELIDSLYTKLKKSIKPSQCFYNSQIVIINDTSNQIKYHEGFCYADLPFPIFHGWNSLNGKLLDFTLEYKRKFKFSEESHMGIEVDKAWVLDRILNKKNSTAFLENEDDVYSALRTKYIKPSSK